MLSLLKRYLALPRADTGLDAEAVMVKHCTLYREEPSMNREVLNFYQASSIDMSLGMMFELDISPGTGVLVGVVDASGQPVGADRRFDIIGDRIQECACLGHFYIHCTVWPSPMLKGNMIRCNTSATAMLGNLSGSLDVVVILPKKDKLSGIFVSQDPEQREGTDSSFVVSHARVGMNALAPCSQQEAFEEGGDITPRKKNATPGRKSTRSATKKTPQFAAMSPSMRKSMQQEELRSQNLSGTPRKNLDGKGDPPALVDMDLIREALEVGGTKLKYVLALCFKKKVKNVFMLPGNVYPFPFFDAPLAATIVAPFEKGTCAPFTIDGGTHLEILTHNSNQLDVLRESVKGMGYAEEAVSAVSEMGQEEVDNAISMSVFRAASAGYMSLKNVENIHIGGMEMYVNKLRKWISFPLSHYDRFRRQGALPPTGVLLHGPPGTGKTLLARWIAHDASAKLFVINGSELMSENLGEAERCLSAIFQAAIALCPSIIFIDEIDVLGPSRETSTGMSKAANRLVATLTGALDSLYGHAVMVVGATNRKDSIDESLRRPRRLDKELEIGVPNPEARFEILNSLLHSMHNQVTIDDIKALSLKTHGFVGADLFALCSEASMIALRRYVSEGSSPVVSTRDMEIALYHTKPSALREFATEIPNVSLMDVGGNHLIKQKLKEAVEWPIKLKDHLDRMGAVPPKGILLHGPPGCSKTLLVKAIAGECRLNFFSVKGPELMSKYVGESEKALATIFERARKASPAILFFDEIDGLVGSRSNESSGGVDVSERVLSQMLQEMDGIKGKDDQVVVIGATNRIDRLDKALLRPGRFDKVLEVTLPSSKDRFQIFNIHLKQIPIDSSVSLEDLVRMTDGCSGADIASICQKAAMHALCVASPENVVTFVTQNDFNAVIKM